ncbi:peptidylprolyl isomerase, partial [Caldimonas sp.]|uniref:peptidylprolyl isomerase n=1 Tax=Caldimonas sp. TaxID=2838790 RepID=UPI00391AC23A
LLELELRRFLDGDDALRRLRGKHVLVSVSALGLRDIHPIPLGGAIPGQFVPEFERVMNALPTGRLSDPFLSRFGAHLVQVTDRRETRIDPREQRELARNVLRERKYEQAYEEWAREIRERAYIDIRVRPEL